MVWQGWNWSIKPGLLLWHFFFLAHPKHSSSNCFNPFTYYLFSQLVIWPALQIFKKMSLKMIESFFVVVIYFSLLRSHGQGRKQRQWQERKIWFFDQSSCSRILLVEREDRRDWQRIAEPVSLSDNRSYTMEGSYIPIWYQMETCEKGCLLGHNACIQFLSRKLAVVRKSETDAWPKGHKILCDDTTWIFSSLLLQWRVRD